MKLTALAVDKRVAAWIITLAVLVLGALSFVRLPVDFLPDVTYPLIKVHIWWRGATPAEIDKNVAELIERQMATVDGVDFLESSSIEGMYTLQVNFRYGADVDIAYQDAMAAMGRAARELPDDMDAPVVIKADPSQLPVAQVTVRSESMDLVELRDWTDNWLQDRLLTVPGVAGVDIVGGLRREIRIHVDPVALEKLELTLGTLDRRLSEENVEAFAGRVTTGPRETIARTVAEYRSLDEIRNIVLAKDGHEAVRLKDVALVEDAHEDLRVMTRLNGSPCVRVSVLKQADANTLEVARAVNRKLEELNAAAPAGVQLGLIENQADYIESAVRGVRDAGAQVALLVVLVIWLFLGSWRQVAVMLVVMPVTLVASFAWMKLAGFSLNIFSLGGMVIAIGVILDNSTVVVENITRILGKDRDATAADATKAGTKEVGSALVAATLSFVALFVPFLLVPGLASLLFRELILVVAGVVVISLVAAVTLTPMLTATLVRVADDRAAWTRRLGGGLARAYGASLRGVLRLRWASVPLTLALIAAGVLVVRGLGSEFLPKIDDGRVTVKVKLPTGASVGETDRVLQGVEQAVGDDERVRSAFTLAGGKVWGLYTFEVANEGQLDLQLVPRSDRQLTTQQYIAEIRPKLAKLAPPGAKIMPMPMPIKGIRKLGDSDIDVELRGPELDTLFELASRTAGLLRQSPELTNVTVSLDMSKPEYQVRPDRDRAASLGVSAGELSTTLRTLLSGSTPSRYRDGEEYYDIRVVVPEADITSKQDVEQMPLVGANHGILRVGDVASVTRAVCPVEIIRKDQIKQVVVRADVAEGSVGQALEAMKPRLAQLALPPGYDIEYGGQAQMVSEMTRTLLAVLAMALFFSFVVLGVQFNSLRIPFVILASVPASLAGCAFALWVAGLPLGATVILGVLLVVAVTVNDGVLLVTFARDLQREGRSALDAVAEAARVRLRPRVMTTATTMAGMVPLALNWGDGGDMLQPMAVAALGGMGVEVLVALFVMPCFCAMVAPASESAGVVKEQGTWISSSDPSV